MREHQRQLRDFSRYSKRKEALCKFFEELFNEIVISERYLFRERADRQR